MDWAKKENAEISKTTTNNTQTEKPDGSTVVR